MGKLFFIGDSITAGAWDERGGWANRLIGEVMQKTLEAFANQTNFYCEPYNLGISGATVADILVRLQNEILARLGPNDKREEAEIVFSIGVNDSTYLVAEKRPRFSDADFRLNLERLISLSRQLVGHVSFLGLLPVDDSLLNPIPWAPEKAYACEHVQRFEQIIQEGCQKHNLPFLPMFERWYVLREYKSLLIDGVHPNTAGHALMAEQIGKFLLTDEFFIRHRN
jgi:lysophospholipase L1-like esterase